MAAQIDQSIHEVWKNHPEYCQIESTDSFIDQVENAAQRIQSYIPECCREHLEKIGK